MEVLLCQVHLLGIISICLGSMCYGLQDPESYD